MYILQFSFNILLNALISLCRKFYFFKDTEKFVKFDRLKLKSVKKKVSGHSERDKRQIKGLNFKIRLFFDPEKIII